MTGDLTRTVTAVTAVTDVTVVTAATAVTSVTVVTAVAAVTAVTAVTAARRLTLVAAVAQEPFGREFDIGNGKSLFARAESAEQQAKWLKAIGDFFSRY